MASALLMPAGGAAVGVGLLTRGPWLAAGAASAAVLSAPRQPRRAKTRKKSRGLLGRGAARLAGRRPLQSKAPLGVEGRGAFRSCALSANELAPARPGRCP